MSLRTKLLAALVALNGAFLLLALQSLMREDAAGPDVTRELRALLPDLAAATEPADRARVRTRLEELQRTAGLGDLFLVEEDAEVPTEIKHTVVRALDALAGAGAAAEVKEPQTLQRVVEQFKDARRRGDTGHLVLLFPASVADPESGRRGLVAAFAPAAERSTGVRDAFLVLVVGVVAISAVSFWLLSRLVTRPLAQLTAAADRIAEGDFRVLVEERGAGDEIDRTIAAFRRMAREIAEYQGHLEDRVLSALQRIRKTEKQMTIAQRLAATGNLAAGVAHEINNPLGGMKNAVRALARGDLSAEKTGEYLDLVSEGLSRVEETVKKFLAFTPRSMEPRPTDLADVARNALGLARHRIERKGIRLVEHFAPPGESIVFGDPHELQQVALNLLLNAADAVPEGRKGTIEVGTRAEGDGVVLWVTDDGVGMSPEDQARCFDLFFTTKPVGEGTGLGLAVVHTVVTNHGGRIDLESAPGRGTTFRVHLPREAPAEAGPGAGGGGPLPGSAPARAPGGAVRAP